MKMTLRFGKILALLAALSLLAAACGGGGGDTTLPETSTTATETSTTVTETSTTTTTVDDELTEVNIGAVFGGVKEEGYYSTLVDSMERIKEEHPHGLTVNFDFFESIAYADGERVIGEMAASGKYDIILGHSLFGESVAAVKDLYPDIAFVFSGSGNEPLGGNGYWIDVYLHEPAYLTGIIAGMMTKTNRISAVAAFPTPNVNLPLNAYIAGAKSVNPDIVASATYIESWFDPATAKESAASQIALGSDMIYAERQGVFEAAAEAKDVYAFGHYTDQGALSPDVVLTSTIARWDPAMMAVIDAWYAHVTAGTPYDAPMDRIVFSLADGGSDLAAMSDLVPADVQAAVEEARAKIVSGELVVEENPAPIE